MAKRRKITRLFLRNTIFLFLGNIIFLNFHPLTNMIILITEVKAQSIVASLGDPCDCNQNHDYWLTMIDEMSYHLTSNLPNNLFNKISESYRFFRGQSCIWSAENEQSHRLAALSDCIPGFIAMKIACIQAMLIKARELPEAVIATNEYSNDSAVAEGNGGENRNSGESIAERIEGEGKSIVNTVSLHMAEMLRLMAFGKDCIDNSVWPLSVADIHSNYIRFYRTISYYSVTGDMLKALVWV